MPLEAGETAAATPSSSAPSSGSSCGSAAAAAGAQAACAAAAAWTCPRALGFAEEEAKEVSPDASRASEAAEEYGGTDSSDEEWLWSSEYS